ncbi:MAG: SRPBCC family protein [Maritimibacter sp.]|jgi:hypothetical protein
MKLTAREDISAPIEAVFQQLSDFDGFERSVLRRGAELARTDSLSAPGPGMSWRAGFEYRGRKRDALIEMTSYTPSEQMCFQIKTSGLDVALTADLVAMSRGRTRMSIATDLAATTLPSRLLLKSLKLARHRLQGKFRNRISEFAVDLEGRCHAR